MKIKASKCSLADFDYKLAVNMWKEKKVCGIYKSISVVLFFHVTDITDMHKFNYDYTVKLCV